MTFPDKEVYYNCKDCEYYNTPEDEKPCHECLNRAVREYTHTPLHFKKKKLHRKRFNKK